MLIAGTVVTGSGPHSGARPTDPHNSRFPITPANATQLHADLVFLAVGLTVALWFALRATNAPAHIVDTVRDLFLVLMAQGVIGYIQYFTHLPVLLVGLHMLGATHGVGRHMAGAAEHAGAAPGPVSCVVGSAVRHNLRRVVPGLMDAGRGRPL